MSRFGRDRSATSICHTQRPRRAESRAPARRCFRRCGVEPAEETGRAGTVFAIEDLQFRKPLVLDRDGSVILRTALDGGRRQGFHGRSQRQTAWTRHAEGRLSALVYRGRPPVDIEELQASLGETLDVAAFYRRFGLGLEYGPNFRCITELRSNSREVIVKLAVDRPNGHYDIEHVFHPALLDSAFQSLLAAVEGDGQPGSCRHPSNRLRYSNPAGRSVVLREGHSREDDALVGDVYLMDRPGTRRGKRRPLCPDTASGKPPGGGHRTATVPSHLAEDTLDPRQRRTGAWLLLAEEGVADDSFASGIAGRLRDQGCEKIVTIGVDMGGNGSGTGVATTVTTAADWQRLFEDHRPDSLAGMVYITSPAIGRLRQPMLRSCAPALLEASNNFPLTMPRLCGSIRDRTLAGRGSPAILPTDSSRPRRADSFSVAHNEYPGLNCSMVDHDGHLG